MNYRLLPLLIALPGLCTACFLPKLQVAPYIATYEASGHIAAVADSGSISASNEADLSDLGLDGVESSVGARLDFEWLGAHASINTMDTSFGGDGQVDTDITLEGQTISAGTDVRSDLDLTSFTGALTWDIIPTELLDVELGVGLTQLELDFQLDPDGADSVGTDASRTIPLVVGRVGSSLAGLDFNGTLGVFKANVGGFDGTISDLDLNASYGIIGGDNHLRGALMVGYRRFEIDSSYSDSDSDVEANFRISGPYFGVNLSF